MSDSTDRPDHRRAILDCVLAHLQEHPECVDKDTWTGGKPTDNPFCRETSVIVSVDRVVYEVSVTRVSP